MKSNRDVFGRRAQQSPQGTGPRSIPQLLVSVRSRHEADQALQGGAEILDVKEPSLGSLGMAPLPQIAAIAGHPAIRQGEIPLSVALGEVGDWAPSKLVPQLPTGITFAKLGLSQCTHQADWQAGWLRVRQNFERLSLSPLRWVAVAYVDAAEAGSPSISAVLNEAQQTDCCGLLLDTWTKDGRMLLDEIAVAELTKIADACHQSGLFLALAGRLNLHRLSDLSAVDADVIAIRSAACRGNDRTTELVVEGVVEFKAAVKQQFASAVASPAPSPSAIPSPDLVPAIGPRIA